MGSLEGLIDNFKTTVLTLLINNSADITNVKKVCFTELTAVHKFSLAKNLDSVLKCCTLKELTEKHELTLPCNDSNDFSAMNVSLKENKEFKANLGILILIFFKSIYWKKLVINSTYIAFWIIFTYDISRKYFFISKM